MTTNTINYKRVPSPFIPQERVLDIRRAKEYIQNTKYKIQKEREKGQKHKKSSNILEMRKTPEKEDSWEHDVLIIENTKFDI